jgi:hypothetical protein
MKGIIELKSAVCVTLSKKGFVYLCFQWLEDGEG